MAIARFDNVNVKKKKTARFDDVQQKSDGRYSAKAAGNAAAPQTSQQSSSALPTLSAEEARSRARALFAPSAAAKAGMEFAAKEEKETQYMPSLVMPQSREDQLWLENREMPLLPDYDPTETKSSMIKIAQQYARGNYSSPAVDTYERIAENALGDISEKVKHPEIAAYEQERKTRSTADKLAQGQYTRDILAGDAQSDDAYTSRTTADVLVDTEAEAKSAARPKEQTKAQSDREAYYTAGIETFESIPLEKRDILYDYFWIRQVADSVPDTKNEIRYKRPDGQTVVISREKYNSLKSEYESLITELGKTYSVDDIKRMQNTLAAYANELNRAQSDVLTAKFATMQPVVASVGSIGGRMVGGITATADLIGQNLAKIGKEDGYKKPVDYNTWASETLNAANVGRGTVSENISYTAGDFASFIYDATMSIADTTITGALPGGKVLSSVSLVASTAFDSAKAAADRGAADWQALGVGLVSGALELAVEKIPKFGTLSRLEDLKEIPIASLGELVRSTFASAHLEGCEEALTEILNRINECAWSPSTSSLAVAIAEYEAQNNSFTDALMLAVRDMSLDVLKAYGGGFIGGAEMQGSLGTMNYALNIGTAKEYRDLFVGSDGKLNETTYNALMTKALSSKDEAVQKYAAVLADRRDSVTANEAGMLYAMVEASEEQVDFAAEIDSPARTVEETRSTFSKDGQTAFDIAMEGATDPEATARQFKIKYLEGETGAEFTVDEDGELTPSMQEAAYKYGAEAARVQKELTSKSYNTKAGTVYIEEGAEVSSSLEEIADTAAKDLHVPVSIVKTLGGTRGFYRTSSGEVVVAADAVVKVKDKDGNEVILKGEEAARRIILGHELTHRLKHKGGKAYARFERFVRDHVPNFDNVVAKYMKTLELDKTAATEEVVCDYAMVNLFSNAKIAEEITVKHSKIAEIIRDFMEWVRVTFGKKSKLGEIELAAKLWNDAYSAAARNSHNSAKTKNTADSGVMFSRTADGRYPDGKDPRDVTSEEVKTLLESAYRKEMDDDSYFPVKGYTPRILIEASKEAKRLTGEEGIELRDNPMAMQVYKARQAMCSEESWDGKADHEPHNLSSEEILSILEAIDDPIRVVYQGAKGTYAVVVNYYKQGGKTKAFAIVDSIDTYKRVQHMNGYGSGEYSIFITTYNPRDDAIIRLFNDKRNVDIPLNKLKKDLAQSGSGKISPSHLNAKSFSDTMVPQDFDGVKSDLSQESTNGTKKSVTGTEDILYSSSVDSNGDTLTEQQAEYFADSKIRDEDGNLLVVYHGTEADFTVFDMSKGRANMDIQGSFFSPWEIDAQGYGSKVEAYYLNIKNPASGEQAYAALNRFKGQNNAGVKAKEYLIKQGYDGINGYGEEYIAFYPEQIKKVDNKTPTSNPDIRYSTTGTEDILFESEAEKARYVADSFDLSGAENYKAAGSMERMSSIANSIAKAHRVNKDGRTKLAKALEKGVQNMRKAAKSDDVKVKQTAAEGFLEAAMVISPDADVQAQVEIANALAESVWAEMTTDRLPETIRSIRDEAINSAIADVRAERLAQLGEKYGVSERSTLVHEMFYGRKYAKIISKKEDRITDLKRKGAEEQDKLKKQHRDSVAKTREKRNAADMREKIMRHAKDLSAKLLEPTDKKHIPKDFKETVAALLEAINLESNIEVGYTHGADGKLHKNADGAPPKRTQAFKALKAEYAKILQDGDSSFVPDEDLFSNEQDGFVGLFDQVIAMENIRIADMSLGQLEIIWRTMRSVEKAITTYNKAFNAARFETISGAAIALENANAGKKPRRYFGGILKYAEKGRRWTTLDMMTPETFFHFLGKPGDSLFRMMRDAQDKHISILREATTFTNEAVQDNNIRNLEKEVHKVTLGGKTVEVSTAQLMELYVLMRREQAKLHIFTGGIKLNELQTKAISKPEISALKVTEEEINIALANLTLEQRQLAEALQGYLSNEMSAYGNEASMEVYGYEKFNEEFYWPIHVTKNELKSDVQKQTAVTTVANKGITRNTVPNVNTSLAIDSIFKSYADHIVEMASYAAWLSADIDITRIYNYSFHDGDGARVGTVKDIFERVHGKGGTGYVEKLLTDIAVGVKSTSSNKLFSNVKIAAVAANLRVILQQPTAYIRAADMINAKYLVAGLIPRGGWKKALKYAPIAQWKDWGYFDINTGRQIKDVLFKSDSALDKVKNFFMLGASKADSATWGALWNACELETKAKNKMLEPGSEAFYTAVADRFTRIVDHTQVVDGILQRSQNLRSPDGLTQMYMAFMGEPIKQYNMVMSAVYDIGKTTKEDRREAGTRMITSVSALAVSAVINSAMQALMDALRDDDRDKEWDEKFVEAYGENLLSAVNPLNYIPLAKDFMSLLKGYDVSRTDMDGISKAINAFMMCVDVWSGDSKHTAFSATNNLLLQLSDVFGIPLDNLRREVKAGIDTVFNLTDNYAAQFHTDKVLYSIKSSKNNSRYYDLAFNALKTDDYELYNTIRSEMMNAQEDMTGVKFDSAMRSRYKDASSGNSFTMSQKAMDLIGIGIKYNVEDTPETFGADDLDADEFKQYSEKRAEIYRDIVDDLEGLNSYHSFDNDSKNKMMSAVERLAEEYALMHASDEAHEVDTKWMLWAVGGEDYGVDESEAIMFKALYEGTPGDKDSNGKTKNGSKKKNVEAARDEKMPWLTDEEKEYLNSFYWSE